VNSPLVRIRNITRHYGDYCAVDRVSFDLHAGEIVGLLGPNGAGKSTSMQIISGCLAPGCGEVLLNGVDLIRQPIEAKRSLGYLPEIPPLYPEMRVDEYLDHCARLHGVPRGDATEARERAKRLCGLAEHGRRLIQGLSKGYQQRVGIAQAIIHRPKVIILDEPTSGLDPNQIIEIRMLIKSLAEQCGILLSTHILQEAQSLCDRVEVLNQGRLVFSEALDKLENATAPILLTLAAPPGISELETLPGITRVDDLGGGCFRLTREEGLDPAAIAERAVTNGWRLRLLTPERQNLEAVFTRLTSGESP
jgi:ABC-2 type transport system ATP-binding protein